MLLLCLLLACTGASLDQGPGPTGQGTGDSGAQAGDGGGGEDQVLDTGQGDQGEAGLAMDQAVYELGERILVQVQGYGEVVLLPAGRQELADSPWRQAVGSEGAVLFHPVSLAPGWWQAVLQDGADTLASADFQVVDGSTWPPPEPVEGTLAVMSFNTWEGASRGPGGPAEVARVIAKTEADVIALQDCDSDTLAELATLLALEDGYAQVVAVPEARLLSRLPLLELHTAQVYARGASLELPDGSALRVFNAHLTEIPSGLELAAEGASAAEIRTLEGSTRAAELSEALALLVEAEAHHPERATVFMGTLSSPSHLDWTEENRLQGYDLVLDWPVSMLMAEHGYTDAFRAAWPDPVAVRGFTRSPGQPKGELPADLLHERLDHVYLRPAEGGSLQVHQAWTVARDPWPSDHRAVVTRFSLD